MSQKAIYLMGGGDVHAHLLAVLAVQVAEGGWKGLYDRLLRCLLFTNPMHDIMLRANKDVCNHRMK